MTQAVTLTVTLVVALAVILAVTIEQAQTAGYLDWDLFAHSSYLRLCTAQSWRFVSGASSARERARLGRMGRRFEASVWARVLA